MWRSSARTSSIQRTRVSAPDPRFTLARLPPPGRYGALGDAPVRISEQFRDLVQVFARKGRRADLAAALRASYGFDLPPAGHGAVSGDVAALWIQPDGWLLTAPRGAEGALAAGIKLACGDAGSMVDQTHGRAVLRLSGANAPRVLAKLCRIDLHPRVFGLGRVAVAPVAELSCVLYQYDALPSYDLVFSATHAGSFVASLTHAAVEVGCDIA
jgi:heterotetrameric sarcosine oxidase gamma subunit